MFSYFTCFLFRTGCRVYPLVYEPALELHSAFFVVELAGEGVAEHYDVEDDDIARALADLGLGPRPPPRPRPAPAGQLEFDFAA
ncbi:hypothetical protein [Enhygromyxa salina]|uniref:hypothetical protein n=1 Tax=Enhygromyxa salina TaxID=215803 RepID=UPI0011B26B16|nr:hypothetical protein [Enhygromyxa salina]